MLLLKHVLIKLSLQALTLRAQVINFGPHFADEIVPFVDLLFQRPNLVMVVGQVLLVALEQPP